MMTSPKLFFLMIVGVIALTTLPCAVANSQTTKNETAQAASLDDHPLPAKPDKALLYVIRPKLPAGGNTMKRPLLFDNTYILSVKGQSWAHAYVDPGRYLVYGLSWAKYLEFMPGEIYYMAFDLSGVFSLNEEEALSLIKEGGYQQIEVEPLSEKKAAKKARKERPRFEKGRQKMIKKKILQVAEVMEIEVPDAPSDREGYVEVPAYSPVKLTLIENVSGTNDKCGDDIWFEIAEDCMIAGTVWARAGTAVTGRLSELSQPAGGGHSGRADIIIQAVPAVDGTLIPASAQWISSGRSRVRGASIAFGFIGIFSAAIKGRPAFEPNGLIMSARTRGPVWIKKTDADETQKEKLPTVDMKPIPDMTLTYHPKAKTPAPMIRFELEPPTKIEKFALAYINGKKLPIPSEARVVACEELVCSIMFSGWNLLNYIRPFENNELLFHAIDDQDNSHYALMNMKWEWEINK